MRNAETMTITLTRIEVCDIMLACTLTGGIGKYWDTSKWDILHDKIAEQLDAWDNEYDKTHAEI